MTVGHGIASNSALPPNHSFKRTNNRCAVICRLTPTLGTSGSSCPLRKHRLKYLLPLFVHHRKASGLVQPSLLGCSVSHTSGTNCVGLPALLLSRQTRSPSARGICTPVPSVKAALSGRDSRASIQRVPSVRSVVIGLGTMASSKVHRLTIHSRGRRRRRPLIQTLCGIGAVSAESPLH
jgi:hypothetical protein